MPKSVAIEIIIKGMADWISVISGNFIKCRAHKIIIKVPTPITYS